MATRHYMVVAKRHGYSQARWIHSFGIFQDEDQLMRSVELRLARDAMFREKWTGYDFCPALVDHTVRVFYDGTIYKSKRLWDNQSREAIIG